MFKKFITLTVLALAPMAQGDLSHVKELSIKDFKYTLVRDTEVHSERYIFDLELSVNSNGGCVNLNTDKMKVLMDQGSRVVKITVVQDLEGSIQFCVAQSDKKVKVKVPMPFYTGLSGTQYHTIMLTTSDINFEGEDIRNYHTIKSVIQPGFSSDLRPTEIQVNKITRSAR